MEGFTIIDGVVAGVIVLSAILAYSRGLVREGMAIAGWIGAAVLAYVFAAQAQPLVKELPVIGNFLGDSCELSVIAAFAAVFAIGLVLAALFTPLLSTWVNQSVLGGLDQALGFLFGAARGILLLVVAVAFWNWLIDVKHRPDWVNNAKSKPFLDTLVLKLEAVLPADIEPQIRARILGKEEPRFIGRIAQCLPCTHDTRNAIAIRDANGGQPKPDALCHIIRWRGCAAQERIASGAGKLYIAHAKMPCRYQSGRSVSSYSPRRNSQKRRPSLSSTR